MTNWCSAGGERPDMKRNDNWPSENKVFVFGLGFIWLQKVKSQSHSSLNALRWNVQDGPTSAWNMERRAARLTFRNDFNFTMTNASSGQQTTPRRNSHSEVMWISGTQGCFSSRLSIPSSLDGKPWRNQRWETGEMQTSGGKEYANLKPAFFCKALWTAPTCRKGAIQV